VVARAGLGTLSDTGLTVRATESAGLWCAGIVVGSWPAGPGPAERCNVAELPRLNGVPVLGRLPAGAAALKPAAVVRRAPGWFADGPPDAALPSRGPTTGACVPTTAR